MPAQISRATRARAGGVLAVLAAALLLGGCMQGVCAQRPDGAQPQAGDPGDVVGCGGHWDQIYRTIHYPESPGG